MKVFVYGSLMKNYWNHKFLINQEYIGKGLLHGYEMYHVSSFPGIIKAPGGEILGEVYEIDQETLKKLDRLESEGSMYLRVEEDIIMDNEITKADVYIWNGNVAGYEKVKEKPWKPNKSKWRW